MSSDKIWNDFPGCLCLKSILISTGYDNIKSLLCIDAERLTVLEKYVEENRSITDNLTCDHAESYSTPHQFKFLPGHRAIILDWCQTKLPIIEKKVLLR